MDYEEALLQVTDVLKAHNRYHMNVPDHEQAVKLIRDIVTPKGKWIRTGSLGNGNAHYTCSNCSYGDEHAESQEVPYCWHCGADMRGDL